MALSCPKLFSNLSLVRLCIIRTKTVNNGFYSHHLSCFSRFVLDTRTCCPSQLILLISGCVLWIFLYYELNMCVFTFLGCDSQKCHNGKIHWRRRFLYELHPNWGGFISSPFTDRPCADTILHPKWDEVLGDMSKLGSGHWIVNTNVSSKRDFHVFTSFTTRLWKVSPKVTAGLCDANISAVFTLCFTLWFLYNVIIILLEVDKCMGVVQV